MIPGVVPPETPDHHIRNALQIIALAQYAKTASGEPGRILTDDEHKAVSDRLFKAVRQLEAGRLIARRLAGTRSAGPLGLIP